MTSEQRRPRWAAWKTFPRPWSSSGLLSHPLVRNSSLSLSRPPHRHAPHHRGSAGARRCSQPPRKVSKREGECTRTRIYRYTPVAGEREYTRVCVCVSEREGGNRWGVRATCVCRTAISQYSREDESVRSGTPLCLRRGVLLAAAYAYIRYIYTRARIVLSPRRIDILAVTLRCLRSGSIYYLFAERKYTKSARNWLVILYTSVLQSLQCTEYIIIVTEWERRRHWTICELLKRTKYNTSVLVVR